MFAVADGQLLQGMKNRYLVDFSAYFIKMKIFEEVNDILHFLQSVTISWCNFLACSLVFLNCFRVSKRDCFSFNRSKFLSLWSGIFMITHKDVDQVTNDDDTENKS